MKTYLLAVSGGVDSVVLLDMFAKSQHRIIVAHVDHGIRDDSSADARFVEELAKKYHSPFVSKRYELGASASEEQARVVRYEFLREQAKKFNATIVTAHHQGDVIETVAINIDRGTGWRGIAVMGNTTGIERPLLAFSKQKLIKYATDHRLEWVEDATNASDKYLRNRLRKRVNKFIDESQIDSLMKLRASQLVLRRIIERELMRFNSQAQSRYFLNQIDTSVAEEILGQHIFHESDTATTRPQRERALLAVKTARSGSLHQVAGGVELMFDRQRFTVVNRSR